MYTWERAGVRVISNVKVRVYANRNHPALEITLTLTLSHEYAGEGTRVWFQKPRHLLHCLTEPSAVACAEVR